MPHIFGMQLSLRNMLKRVAPSYVAVLIILCLWFVLTVAPWMTEAPDLDAMVNLRESFVFYNEGLDGLLKSRGGSTHPPLLYLLNSVAFFILRPRPESVYLMGFFLSALTSCIMLTLFRKQTDDWRATAATLVLAMNPLVACCYVYMMSEALIVMFFCICTLALSQRRFVLLSLCLCGFALVKQTALVFLGSFAITFFLSEAGTKWRRLVRSFLLVIPSLVCALVWLVFLSYRGGGAWNSELMNGNAGGNPFITFFKGIFTGFLSVYFKQNFVNAFVINFNWFALIGFAFAIWIWIRNSRFHFRSVLFLSCAIGAVFYVVFVFPFPTWTIPRYGLPALFPILVLMVFSMFQMRWNKLFLTFVAIVFVIAQFRSIDPVSFLSYGLFSQRKQKVFDTDYAWRGPDRVMYNFQFALMSREQNRILNQIFASEAEILLGDCADLKIGEKIYTFAIHHDYYRRFQNVRYIPCIEESQLENTQKASNLDGKKVALLPSVKSLNLKYSKPRAIIKID